MNEDVINVFGYKRVSTERQVKKGYSLEEQQEEIEDYCKSQGYYLMETFKDEGISGAKANEDEMSIERDGLLEMLSSIKNNNVRYIVVLSTNRLWRSDLVKVLVQRELKKNGMDIKAIDRPNYSIYTQNPNEFMINGMFELLDVYERLEIALKMKRGRIQKAKGGGYAGGGVPYGYYCMNGGKKLNVNTAEAKAVKRIFQVKRLYPEVTLQCLSDLMDVEGYKGRNGKGFNPMLVKRILDREEFYKGKYKYADIEGIGDYEPIL